MKRKLFLTFPQRILGEPLLYTLGRDFKVVPPYPAEVADEDALDLERLAFHFNHRSYGRLRDLVDRLNAL